MKRRIVVLAALMGLLVGTAGCVIKNAEGQDLLRVQLGDDKDKKNDTPKERKPSRRRRRKTLPTIRPKRRGSRKSRRPRRPVPKVRRRILRWFRGGRRRT
ncbi:MAG: hypothetical protein M5R36_20885 [Deltaproteobacteria bacterium]|nr:hypothetical protein [Deltaproteobacteria bacterium]